MWPYCMKQCDSTATTQHNRPVSSELQYYDWSSATGDRPYSVNSKIYYSLIMWPYCMKQMKPL